MAYNYGNYYGNNTSWNAMNQPVNYSQGMNYQQPGNVSYSPSYGQTQQPQMNQMPMQQNYSQGSQQHTGINWVQGQAGANAFYLAPGQSALLMDIT